jgi:ABC-type multidrug transport system fused ATPase/permease subunit
MNTTSDDNLLRSYLLGTLPEADTETCDELSFTDDAFIARLQAVEDDLIDAYLQNELSGNERLQFQSYFLASPRRQEKVKFAQSLQSFAQRQVLAPTIAPAVAAAEPVRQPVSETASWWESLRNLFTLPNLTMQWGMAAAALLLLLAGGWLFTEMQRLRGAMNTAQTEQAALQQRERELQSQLEQQRTTNSKTVEQLSEELKRTQQQLEQLKQQRELAAQAPKPSAPVDLPNLTHADLLPQTRGIGQTVELSIPSNTDYAVLHLVTSEDDFPAYQAELLTQADQKLRWKSGKLKARNSNAARVIDVSVRAKLLPPGSYVVRLNGVAVNGQTEELQKYSFRIVRP